jgi:hypothetical protein
MINTTMSTTREQTHTHTHCANFVFWLFVVVVVFAGLLKLFTINLFFLVSEYALSLLGQL